MIELISVSKYYPTDFGRHYVFRDVSLVLPPDKSVGVLGPNGAGKSTFLRLLGGADVPSEGRVIRSGRISPPMGLTPGLQSSLTAVENARFAGRIYGLSRDEINDLIDHVREIADIGDYFDMPVGTYSAGMRQRVAFGINMSMNFDYYIFDEIGAGGDKDFRKMARARVEERLQTSKFIIASHRTDELLGICDAGIVIQNGELTFFDNIKDALAVYGGDDDLPTQPVKRSRRRDASATAEVPAETGHAPPDDVAIAGSGTEAGSLKRRRRRKAAAEEQPPASDVQGVSESGVKLAAAPVALDDKHEAKLARQRLRQRLRRESRRAALVEAPEAEHASNAANAGTAPDSDSQQARRERRRIILERKRAAADLSGEAERETAAAAPEAGSPQEVAPAPEPSSPTPASPSIAPPPVGTAPMAERRKPLPVTVPETPAPSVVPTPAPGTGAIPQARQDASLAASGFKPLLLQRALLRQQRAEIASARATRLLLQHLDESVSAGTSARQARAWLVAAAQETASHDSAQARQALESLAAGNTAPASAAPLKSFGPSGSMGFSRAGRIPAARSSETER